MPDLASLPRRAPRTLASVAARRFDFAGPVRGVEETPQGGLRVSAAVSKAGVLRYRDTAGKEWAELVPLDELARPESTGTLRGATVTDLHPQGMVTAETYRQLAVGHVHDDVAMDGDYLTATLTVNDAAECARIRAGERRDVSAGYECDLDETPGVHEGEPYDRVQRNRRYNHVGLGPEGWGRAGSDVGLRLDGAAHEVRATPAGAKGMKKIKLRGVEYRLDGDTPDTDKLAMAADEVNRDLQKKDTDIAGLTAQVEGLQKALTDALTSAATLGAQVQALQAAQPADAGEGEMPSDEVLDAHLARREQLRADAAAVLGAGFDTKGKKPSEIKRAVVAKVLPAVKLDGLDEKVIEGMFRGAVAGASANVRNDALAATNNAAANPTTRTDADDDLAAALKKRTAERSLKPLTKGS